MSKTGSKVQTARILIILSAVLWLILTTISVSYALGSGEIFYIPELILIIVTSIILLAWSYSVRSFPHLISKVGYLSILISIMNLLALGIIASSGHPITGTYPGITANLTQNISASVPNLAFLIAYTATAIGIIGGISIIKNGHGPR